MTDSLREAGFVTDEYCVVCLSSIDPLGEALACVDPSCHKSSHCIDCCDGTDDLDRIREGWWRMAIVITQDGARELWKLVDRWTLEGEEGRPSDDMPVDDRILCETLSVSTLASANELATLLESIGIARPPMKDDE